MNQEEKRETLRSHLKYGYKKINNLNSKTRKVQAAQGIVMMKRDKILRQLEEEITHLYKAVEEMKTKFEEDLQNVVDEKISELDFEFEEVQEDICLIMEICVESEKTLKFGNEDLLDKHSSALVSSFGMLLETDENVVDYDQMIVMDYISFALSNTICKRGLGYIRTTTDDQDPPTPFYLADRQTQVDSVVRKSDMASQTFTMNNGQGMRPPVGPNPPSLFNYNNPHNMFIPSQSYRPFIPSNNYIGNPLIMSNPCNYPLNVNRNNLLPNAAFRSAIPFGLYTPRLPGGTPEITRNIRPPAPISSSGEGKLPAHATDLPTNLERPSAASSPASIGSVTDNMNNDENPQSKKIPISKRLPRLPGAKTIDRLMNSNMVSSKLKMPPTSSNNIEDGIMAVKPKPSSLYRFSPTSANCSTPSSGDKTSKAVTDAFHIPQNIQELKELQKHSSLECAVAGDDKPVDMDTQTIGTKLLLNFSDSSKSMNFSADTVVNNKLNIKKEPVEKHEENIVSHLANESWDEELVNVTEQKPGSDNVFEKTLGETKTSGSKRDVTLYPSWHDKERVARCHTGSHNDSGITPDIHSTDAWDKEEESQKDTKKKPKLHPPSKTKEIKNGSRPLNIIKSENGQAKSINLSQFKSLFEKHIESNDSTPRSGHMVGTGASYHIDRNDNCKTEIRKEVEEEKEKIESSIFCISTHIHKQPNWKAVEAFLVHRAGKPGHGASFSEVLNFPIGVTVNSKDEIIVNDTSNHLVKIFKNDTLINVMGLGDVQMQRPSALVVNKNDDVFVKDNCAIYVFDKTGQFKFCFGKDTLKQPYGLVMTEDETLLVLDIQRPAPCLYEFHQDGKMIASYPYQPLEKSQPMSKCRFMAYHNGKLLVSDLGRSAMYLTNRKGETIYQFARYGKGEGEFNEPSGVTVDSDGHWIVADSKNHRLQVFKPNGEFLSIIKFKEPIVRPSDIHLTKDGRIIIVDFLAHMVKVFRLEKP